MAVVTWFGAVLGLVVSEQKSRVIPINQAIELKEIRMIRDRQITSCKLVTWKVGQI